MSLAEIHLTARPRVVNCGLSEHGAKGREEYCLPSLWCLHLYFYAVGLEVGGVRHCVVPGAVTVIPPSRKIVFDYSARHCKHFFVHFMVPARGPKVRIPTFQHLPEARDELLDRLQHIQAVATRNQTHADVLFWGLLFDIADAGSYSSSGNTLPLIKRIDQVIEEGLSTRINVESLARELQFSPGHISRVVKGHYGFTAIQLINKRRLQKAYGLLVHSTMPIKMILIEVGINSLQKFNKLMRRAYGHGPRELRRSFCEKGLDETWTLKRQ
ncbi:MAG: helix-turn-helix domain-containing protein [Terrimicrobiaceae bacterium]